MQKSGGDGRVSVAMGQSRCRSGGRFAIILGIVLTGCGTSFGPVGLISPDPDLTGTKLLRPDAVGRSCRANVLGLPLQEGDPDLQEALARLLALDAEANVVVHAEVSAEDLLTGLYNRRCIAIRGDLARAIPTLTLPTMPGMEHDRPDR